MVRAGQEACKNIFYHVHLQDFFRWQEGPPHLDVKPVVVKLKVTLMLLLEYSLSMRLTSSNIPLLYALWYFYLNW